MDYGQMFKKYPLLGHRLHTLHCESCKPMGVSLSIHYTGTETNGSGCIFVQCFYSMKRFKFSVVNGVIFAFGLRQSMRVPTRMRLSSGFSDYGETGDRLLKDKTNV